MTVVAPDDAAGREEGGGEGGGVAVVGGGGCFLWELACLETRDRKAKEEKCVDGG